MQSNKAESELPYLMEQLNLLTINSDCIHHIFEHLELKDLLNVADTCKTLQAVSCTFFERKHSNNNRMVGIGKVLEKILDDFKWHSFELELGDDEMKRKWKPTSINAHTPIMALKMLRNFGHTISKIHITTFDTINSKSMCGFMQELELYLVEYCWRSLKHLLLTCCDLRLSDLNRPFINIESIIVWCCRFKDNLPFSTNFPNLKSLVLLSNSYSGDFPRLTFRSPALTYLTINEYVDDPYSCLEFTYLYPFFLYPLYYVDLKLRDLLRFGSKYKHPEIEIIKLIKLNPQIEHLKLLRLGERNSSAFLQCVTDYLPQLRHLTVTSSSSLFENFEETFYSESVEHFVFSAGYSSFLYKMPFVFPKLKSLIIHTQYNEDSIISFITKHNEIRSIQYRSVSYAFKPNHLLEAISSNIEELKIDYLALDLDSDLDLLFRLLKEKYRLKKLTISKGRISEHTLSESCKRLCDAMLVNGIQFKVGKLIEDRNGDIRRKKIEFHVKKNSNVSQMENIIQLSTSTVNNLPTTEVAWYTIKG